MPDEEQAPTRALARYLTANRHLHPRRPERTVMPETEEQALTRYLTAMHGVQTGVAHQLHQDPEIAQPKHVRVGITSGQITDQALAELLIDRGIFTKLEYLTKCADKAEECRQQMAEQISRDYGGNTDINLI